MEKPSMNELPDDMILKIFSLLPMYEETVATHLISKSLEDPWELVPDVMFDDDDESYESFVAFMSFVYGSLLFNNPQVLERLHLKLSQNYSASDINCWVKIAVYRSVRKVRINLYGKTLELPSCLSTCTTLKSLILRDLSIEVVPHWFRLPLLKRLHLSSVKFPDEESVTSFLQICPVLEYLVVNQTNEDHVMFKVVPHWFRLPSLKSLHLFSVKFSGDEAVASLLKSCPALEHLVVNRTKDDNVMLFNINVPSLKSLCLSIINNSKRKRAYVEDIHGFVIDAPSLEILNFKDTFSNFLMFEYMPKVIEANIEVVCDQSEKFIGSLTSIQHFSLCCLTSQTPYPRGTFFFFLEHLELCTCSAGWSNLLTCILNDAPRLQSLKLKSQHSARYNDPMNNLWNVPKPVPECLSKHLEILEWRQYEGTEQEREVAAYILANATCLKMATFSTRCRNKYHRMLKKLKKLNRVSETCQLVFD